MNKDETTPPVEDRDRFVEHLDRASEIVRAWPVWKQTILGGVQLGHSAEEPFPANGLGCSGVNGEDAG